MINSKIWDTEIISIGDYTLELSQVIAFVAIVVLTFLVSHLIKRSLSSLGQHEKFQGSPHVYIVSRIAHYCILVLGFIFAVSMLGLDIGRLALIVSALGVGIGLGLQGIVNNFVSGLALLLEKTLKVGDFIELDSGVTGEVKEIHMRATLVRTNDNVDILIPNAELTSGKVINWTLEEDIRRFRVPFGVAYGSNKEVVRDAALEAAKEVPYTLYVPGREPVVWMESFGDSSLNFILGVWVTAEQVKRPTALMSDYLWAIDDAFRKYNITIPFPQRDLHIKSRSGEEL